MKFIGMDGESTASYGEINIDDAMRTKVVDTVREYMFFAQRGDKVALLPADLFDEAQGWIYSMMEQDSFRKFAQSRKYKAFKGARGLHGSRSYL